MPWPLGISELQARLKAALGIRGNLPLELDESIIPIVRVMDLEQPQWSKDPIYGAYSRIESAAAGFLSEVGVVAQLGTILVVEKIVATNEAAAATRQALSFYHSPTGFTIRNTFARNLPGRAANTPAVLGSSGVSASNRAVALNPAEGLPTWRVPLGESITILLDWVLFGDDPLGQQALIASPNAVNEGIGATFFVREYSVR